MLVASLYIIFIKIFIWIVAQQGARVKERTE